MKSKKLEDKVKGVYHCPKTDFYWKLSTNEINGQKLVLLFKGYDKKAPNKKIPKYTISRKWIRYKK